MAEKVIQRLELLPILFAKDWDPDTKQWRSDKPPSLAEAVLKLDDIVSSPSDEQKGVVIITAEHTDSVLAAAIANQYVETLQQSLNSSAFSLAKKNRIFVHYRTVFAI